MWSIFTWVVSNLLECPKQLLLTLHWHHARKYCSYLLTRDTVHCAWLRKKGITMLDPSRARLIKERCFPEDDSFEFHNHAIFYSSAVKFTSPPAEQFPCCTFHSEVRPSWEQRQSCRLLKGGILLFVTTVDTLQCVISSLVLHHEPERVSLTSEARVSLC